ncbi:aldose epimerase family protein [Pediococcus argentinicus]|uniref:aldose epimerase family protein n=1 Tax=Pediococcus argentinicus TaxID=480391 RepID=UPI00338FFDC7
MKIESEHFDPTTWYTLSNDNQISVTISTLGATVVAINTPDKDGKVANIVLGFKDHQEYLNHHDFFGASIARVAGRIKDATWRDYNLDQNNTPNSMHGGDHPSISYSLWTKVSSFTREHEVGLVLKYFSPDNENGYPGDLTMNVIFRLNDQNQFSITYMGHTSKQTLFNPTTHNYFNLSGDASRTIEQHELKIDSDNITEVDENKVPTGNLLTVDNTPFDFHASVSLGGHLSEIDGGLDTPFKVDPKSDDPQLSLFDPESGRKLRIKTSANSFVVFSSTGFEGDFVVNGNRKMTSQLGLAIEPQMLPDAMHHSGFGNVVLSPSKPMMYQNIYYLN